MNVIPIVHPLGAARITRIEETTFGLAPDLLFPDWDAGDSHMLQERLERASLDLVNQRVSLQTHLWVVEINDLTLVIDTGIGNGKSRPFSKLFDRLDNPVLSRFEAAGFRREQVDFVLLTHLHVDHVGWNTVWEDGHWAPVFPNATYVFSQQECDYFDTAAGAARRMVYEDSVLPIIDAGRSRMVPEEGEEILQGIRFVPTPGHSIGHMAITLNSQENTAVFSGDVMHSPLQVSTVSWRNVLANGCCLMPRAQAPSCLPRIFPRHRRVMSGMDNMVTNGLMRE